MRLQRSVWVFAMVLFVAPAAAAQDFGVMESAETINRGNFKLAAYPMFVFPDEGENDIAIGLGLGYGFTNSFDIEGRAALSDDVVFLGGDAEYWLLKNLPLDLSLRGGFHVGMVEGDVGDSRGVDLSVIGSAPIAESLELVGALDIAFNSVDVGATRDGSTTVHLVPGLEIALSRDLDFLAEVGVGVSDASSHYVAFGIAYYLR